MSYSRAARLLIVITALMISQLIPGSEADLCKDHCNNHRYQAGDSDGPYTLECSKATGDRTQCGMICFHCKDICASDHKFSPESNSFNCPSKSRDSESGGLGHGPEAQQVMIVAVVVPLVVVICCCGICGCVWCCVLSKRRQQQQVPMQSMGQYGTPSAMTMTMPPSVASAPIVASGPIPSPAGQVYSPPPPPQPSP